MKYSIVTGICFLFFLLAFKDINAQACGRYYVSVSVQGLDGKPVKNALVKLEPITTDETKGEQFVRDKADPSAFSVSFSEGHSFKEFHKVVVTAAGYQPVEKQIKVLSCQGKHIVVKLAPKGSSSNAVWEFANNVYIDVFNPEEKHIEGATLTVLDDKGKQVPEEMTFGFALFDLPNGKYTFRIQAPGFLDKEVEADLTTIANFYLKVQLMPEGSQP